MTHYDGNDTPRRITVYNPATQHSLLLARALAQEGYDTSLVTRFETESALRQSATVRFAYKVLGQSHIIQRAIENRSVGDVRSFSTDPAGVLLDRIVRETLGRSAMQCFARSRMQHSAKMAARFMSRQLHPELVIAAETGAIELLDEVGAAAPVVIDVAHPHPKEVDRCRRLAAARYPDFMSSWDDPPLEASGWERLDQALTRASGVWTASLYTADAIRRFVDPAMQIDIVGYGRRRCPSILAEIDVQGSLPLCWIGRTAQGNPPPSRSMGPVGTCQRRMHPRRGWEEARPPS